MLTVPLKKIALTQESALKIIIALAWSRTCLAVYCRVAISKLLLNNDTIASVIMGCMIVLLICFYCYRTKIELRYQDFGIYAVFVAIYVVFMLQSTTAGTYLREHAVQFLLTYAPLFLVGILINKERIEFLRKISILTILAYFLYSLLFGTAIEYENMDDAYMLLPHLCLLLYSFVSKRKKLDLLLFIFGAVLVIFFGARGPVLFLFVFALIVLLLCAPRGWEKSLIIVGVAGAAIAFFIFFEPVLLALKDVAIRLGLSSRVFDQMLNNMFFSTDTRESIMTSIINAIKEKPLFGYGMAGDRNVVRVYAHNLFLEFLVSYGVIIGGALSVALVTLLVIGIRRATSQEERLFLLLLICSNGFLKLMISGSYLREPYFYLMVGVCVGIIRRYHPVQGDFLPGKSSIYTEDFQNV